MMSKGVLPLVTTKMLIKKSEINKLKKSIISVFNSDTIPPAELKSVFVFRNDMIYLCDEAIKSIGRQNFNIFYASIMYLFLLILVGLNILGYMHNPVEDDLSLVMMLHSLLSVWFVFIYIAAIKEMCLRKLNAILVLTEFYQKHFKKISYLHPDLKEKLRKLNRIESDKGFEASWLFLTKYKK